MVGVRRKSLDYEYEESFLSPTEIASELKGKKVVFHIKKGPGVDDAQICEGFNVALVALEAGADVRMVFSGSAALDFNGKKSRLEKTAVPERLRKAISYQSYIPLDQIPHNYKDYLEMIPERGAGMFVNTGFNIVLGESDKLLKANPGFEYVPPITYAEVSKIISEGEIYFSY